MAAVRSLVLDVPGPGDTTRQVRISSPDRVLFGDAGLTKADLARYLVAVADPLMRVIADRPLTLQRFPDGVGGEEFYSKNPPRGAPEWMRTCDVTYPSGRTHAQLVIDEVAGAVWCAQMNTITWHPWPVRTQDTDRPDMMRLDLDPQPGRTFADAAEAAVLLRAVLDEAGLVGWAKTSGNRGVHVDVRIRPAHEFLDVRHAVIALAREVARRAPDLVTVAWWKEERGKRVFIDFNQACRDRTIASAYSPRPFGHAPVSTPVSWDELRSVAPWDFTIETVTERVGAGVDPWLGMGDAVGEISTLLAWWQRDLADGLIEMPFPPDHPKMPGEPRRVQPSRARD